jgi:3-(3-hydroxy-phenyl)propionate hydroxylase
MGGVGVRISSGGTNGDGPSPVRGMKHALPDRIDICIIGAGPTGLTLAAALGDLGVDVLIVDRAETPSDIPRAIVLDDEGLRTMQSLGLAETLVPMLRPGVGSRYYDEAGECFAETGAPPEIYGFPRRNFLHQPDLEAVLRDKVRSLESVDLRFGVEANLVTQSADSVTLDLSVAGQADPHRISARYVVACDGGRSPMRRTLGIEMTGQTYGQDWVVVDLARTHDDTSFSKFFCDPARPNVSIPAPRGGRRYEFMVMPGERGEDLLDAETILSLLPGEQEAGPDVLLRKAIYTFHARIAERWRDGRIFLAGDAAHLTPPFAGQGMNAGLRDAHNLAWKLALVVRGLSGPELLESYETERRAPAWSMIQLAVAMGKVVMPANAADAELRGTLFRALEPFPGMKDWLFQMRFKPKPRYADGWFLDLDAPDFDGSLVGEMIPQPSLEPLGLAGRLDDHLGPGFCLLAQDDTASAALGASRHPLWDRLGARRLTLDLGKVLKGGDTRARALRSHRDQILLLRPDRYVAAAIAPADLDSAADRIAATLAPTVAVATPERA